ncbi:hypothetical protein [Oxobacter pfennigii]|nr:hypothetical protein [Oxobacter pfennigii]
MMKERDKITTLRIAFLFTVIISTFSILRITAEVIFSGIIFNHSGTFERILNTIGALFLGNILTIIFAAIILLFLKDNIKKLNQEGFPDKSDGEYIRFATGILIAITGLINLSTSLPHLYSNTKSLIDFMTSDVWSTAALITSIINYSIPVIVTLCQIALGFYWIKIFKNNQDSEPLCIALMFTVITILFSLLDKIIIFIPGMSDGSNSFYLYIRNTSWAAMTVIIIAVLILKIKKSYKAAPLKMLKNETVIMTTGIITVIHGLISLSLGLLSFINYIMVYFHTPALQTAFGKLILLNVISSIIVFGKIFLGFCMFKHHITISKDNKVKVKINKTILAFLAALFLLSVSSGLMAYHLKISSEKALQENNALIQTWLVDNIQNVGSYRLLAGISSRYTQGDKERPQNIPQDINSDYTIDIIKSQKKARIAALEPVVNPQGLIRRINKTYYLSVEGAEVIIYRSTDSGFIKKSYKDEQLAEAVNMLLFPDDVSIFHGEVVSTGAFGGTYEGIIVQRSVVGVPFNLNNYFGMENQEQERSTYLNFHYNVTLQTMNTLNIDNDNSSVYRVFYNLIAGEQYKNIYTENNLKYGQSLRISFAEVKKAEDFDLPQVE